MTIRLPERLEQLLDPYAVLAELRNRAPVVRTTVGHGLDVWLVLRKAEIGEILSHPDMSSDPYYAIDVFDRALRFPQLREHRYRPTDGPEHIRLRRLVSHAFTRERVDALAPSIEDAARALITEIRPNGSADLVSEFALPLSLRSTCALLGVPYSDHEFVHACVAGITQWPDSEAAAAQIAESNIRLRDYLGDLLAEKAASPDTGLLSDLVRARHLDGDGAPSDAMMASTAQVLLYNGYISPAALISNGMLSLLRHPDQLDKLLLDPTLIPSAVEELVRYSGPTFYTFRFTKADVDIAGTTIPQGQIVCVCLPAGNHDDLGFANADELQVTRQNNNHLGFGHGAHYCVGASLARLETRIALSTILHGLPNLELAARPEELPWGQVIRSVQTLPVRFHADSAEHASPR